MGRRRAQRSMHQNGASHEASAAVRRSPRHHPSPQSHHNGSIAAACVFAPVQDAPRTFTVSLAEGRAKGLETSGVLISSLSPEIEAEGASTRLKEPATVLAVARATRTAPMLLWRLGRDADRIAWRAPRAAKRRPRRALGRSDDRSPRAPGGAGPIAAITSAGRVRWHPSSSDTAASTRASCSRRGASVTHGICAGCAPAHLGIHEDEG